MAFKKGTSGNPKGKPKGTKNRPKKPVKLCIERLLERTLPVIEKEMDNATPEVRREFFTDLAGVIISVNKQLA